MSKLKYLERAGASAKLLCGLSIALASAPAWSDMDKAKYTMAVMSETAYGAKIMAGNYAQAIEKINQKAGRYDAFSKGTNLCVAYTKSGELELAEVACESAVIAASKAKHKRLGSLLAGAVADSHDRNLAIALSNRGVLRAVKGLSEQAREDFDAALALDTSLSAPKVNLARLGNEETGPA
jgi:tetratricopeptide (TPR) repeat protein